MIDLGPDPSYYYSPTWSPDSKHIAFADKHHRLWLVDVPSGQARPGRQGHLWHASGYAFNEVWSPDSKWIAYERDLENQLHAIFLYSMDTHKSTQVTDGMSDASSPAFDLNGKYLYFIASTDDGPSHAGIDLSSLDRAQTSAAYVVVLAKDGASPIPPESDDEKIKEEKKDEPQAEPMAPTTRKMPRLTTRIKTRKTDDKDKDKAKSDDKDKDEGRGKDDKDKPVKVTVDLDEHRQSHPVAAHSAAQLRRNRHRQGGRHLSA